MNYSIDGEYQCPFRLFPSFLEEPQNQKITMVLKMRSHFPMRYTAKNVQIQMNLPDLVQSVYFDIGEKDKLTQQAEYKMIDQAIVWKITKFEGEAEKTLVARVSLPRHIDLDELNVKSFGPFLLKFKIPNYNISNLQIKETRVMGMQDQLL